MPPYEITIEKDACDGIFACLTRDPRFVEGADGLATIDPDGDPIYDCEGAVTDTAERVVATFDDTRLEEAKRAAAACPTDAIVVREVGE